MDLEVKVFYPPDVHQPSHLVSDLLFWKNQYKHLANASHDHHRALEKAMEKTNKYLVKMKETGDLGEEERRFFKEVRLYQEILRHQMEKLKQDALVYYELEKDLKRYADDSALKVEKLDHAYRLAKDKLDAQTKAVEDIKKAYHKSMFAKEKAIINGMLASNGSEVQDFRDKLDELGVKANKQAYNYDKQLAKWHNKLEILGQLSTKFETSYREREEARSEKVLSLLQNSIELTHLTLSSRRDADFTGIDGKNIIQEKVIQHDKITVPCFEEYIPQEDTTEMNAMARTDVDPPGVRAKSMISLRDLDHTNPEITTESMEDMMAANRRLKTLRKIRLYLVIKEYKKQSVNQISLKVGEYVRQLLPENADGFAYGEVVHGLLHKKKRGFYPVSNVTVVDKDNDCHDMIEDFENPESDKHRTKRYTKQAISKEDDGLSNRQHDNTSTESKSKKKKQRKLGKVNNGNDTCCIEEYHENTDKESTNPIETAESAPGKKKNGVLNSIARRLRRNKKNKTDIVVGLGPDNVVLCEQEQVVTNVQIFVPDPDSDDEDFDTMRKRKPKIAFQEPKTVDVNSERCKPKIAFEEPGPDNEEIALFGDRRSKIAVIQLENETKPAAQVAGGQAKSVEKNTNTRQKRRDKT